MSTMGVIVGMADAAETDAGLWAAVMAMFPSALAAFSFLLFNLLDSPCLAAISTMAKEMNSKKWTWFAIVYQNVFAYGVTLIVYQLGSLFLGGSFGIGSVAAILALGVLLWLIFRPSPESKAKASLRRVAGANA